MSWCSDVLGGREFFKIGQFRVHPVQRAIQNGFGLAFHPGRDVVNGVVRIRGTQGISTKVTGFVSGAGGGGRLASDED